MKKLLFILALACSAYGASAQFTKATLQASGLTCAMCTRAIDKALKALPFVDSVEPDIKNSAFNIRFKPNATTDVDQLQKAVEDAGFFIAGLKVTGNFSNVPVKNDGHINIGEGVYHFVAISNQTLNGERTLTLVDKPFLTPKAFKKYSAATKMECIQTGKAGNCCSKGGVAANTRIYHVTI